MSDKSASSSGVKPRRVWGLQAKLGILLAATLLLVDISLILITDQRAESSFEQRRYAMATHHYEDWMRLLNASAENLTGLASLLPALRSPVDAQLSSDGGLSALLGEQAALLDLAWGVELAQFYPAEQIPSLAATADQAQLAVHALLSDALQQEKPSQDLICTQRCQQRVAAPLLSKDGGVLGVVLLARSIAPMIVDYARDSRNQIALLVPDAGTAQAQDDARFLSAWRYRVPALSQPEQTLPMLNALASEVSLKELEQGHLMVFSDRHYSLLARRQRNGLVYLIVDEVTDQANELAEDRWVIFLTGTLGLILAMLLLVLFLRIPLLRLQRLVSVLPLIGRHKHLEAEEKLQALPGASSGGDEIDVMVNAVTHLNSQLERIEAARSAAEQRLLWLADHDPLTGLLNRRRFQQDFERQLQLALRHGHSGALLYFDIDDFKAVNDLGDYRTGDDLLKRVAKCFTENLRTTDLVGRMAGDEFALLITEFDERQVDVLIEKLHAQLQALDYYLGEAPHHLSICIGVTYFPSQGDSAEQLLTNADITIYQAKRLGTGQIYRFSDDDATRDVFSAKAYWREQIQDALVNDRFELHYQPILDLHSEQVVRHEVLLRMRDEEGELVSPDQFIPIAEQTGQIRDIDHWVVANALKEFSHSATCRLSVNLSGTAMDDPTTLDWFKKLFAAHDFDPRRLMFEITETVAVQNMERAVYLISELRQLGVAFALDDFGSGFASYNYLKQLPIDYIKIDGIFIRDLAKNPDDQLFVKALTEVGLGLGKKIVAEFVEDRATLRLLKSYGVTHAQGYFIGRPDPYRRDVPYPQSI